MRMREQAPPALRASATRLVQALVTVAAFIAMPSEALAQCLKTKAERPLFLAGGRYDAPLRSSGGVGLLVPLWELEYGDAGCTTPAYRGLLVEGSAGAGGGRLAVGLARRVKEDGKPALFGQDVLLSVIKTGSSPRGADPESKYVGIEAGLTLVAVRMSAGVAQRVGSTGSKATIFIWSVGAQVSW